MEEDNVLRSLPHALGPEKSLLSTMLQDPQEYIGLAIEGRLTKDHFYLPSHSTLFEFIVSMFEAGDQIELVSLIQKLIDKGLLDRVGGPSSVTDLYTYAPSSWAFSGHLKIVKDKFILREMIKHSNETIESAYDQPDEVIQLLDQREQSFMSIRSGMEVTKDDDVKSIVRTVLEGIHSQIINEKGSSGLSTGFAGLDKIGVTLKPGEMFVIAARPSMGKTSFMMNMVENLVMQEHEGMVFSLEMTKQQLIKNLIASRSAYEMAQLSRGFAPNKGDLLRIKKAAIEISTAPLHINDESGLSISSLRAIARRKKRDFDIRWLAIDYLQLMKSSSKQAQSSREREIADISYGLKALAKELKVSIVVLAQLNRGPEGRTGKNVGKPKMSDLRESGAIEQDADMIGLLYRESYYAQDQEEKEACAGVAQIDIAKNRNGPTDFCPLTFVAELMRFKDGHPNFNQK